ncbi:MAG: hypothetical protein KQA41_01880 [Candidatus Aenigmarchaeota archaeon]|nr:hypothetical protein [Candidatus Aenigmarchaeota archaeon]MBU5688955.1 hypothetical protein [Candidatus Aenigmarchaeota archaeon]
MEDRILKEIKAELIKDKKFREELSIALITEILESNDLNISEEEVNKKVKRIFNELVDIKLQQKNILIES